MNLDRDPLFDNCAVSYWPDNGQGRSRGNQNKQDYYYSLFYRGNYAESAISGFSLTLLRCEIQTAVDAVITLKGKGKQACLMQS